MTGVTLFVVAVIGIGLAAGYLGITDGSITINTGLLVGGAFVVGLLFVIGGIFSRDYDKARRINGEIEGKLQGFVARRLAVLGRSESDMWQTIDAIQQEEDEFRETIEYGVVTDGSENYWSYK